MTEFALIILGGLKFGSIYALAALGLVVIHKATRTVNFAHGSFVLLGAFGAFYIQVDKGWPAWAAYLLVPIAVGIFSSAIEVAILRPLRRADLFTVVIATVFLGVVISEGFRLTYKAEILAVPSTFTGAPFFIGPVILTQDALWTICGAIVVSAACIAIFRYAKAARGMRAMAANYRGAQLCGFSVDRTYALAWFFGGAIAGIAGVFAAPAKGVSPELSIIVIASAFVAAVIGGFDSLKGAIYGGLLLGLIETLAAAYGSSALKSAISFLVLFAVMLFRPEGLFPEAKSAMSEDSMALADKPRATAEDALVQPGEKSVSGQWLKWFAPSLCVLAVFLVATQVGTYPQYVATLLVVSMLTGTALTVLVGFARCITLATGAMLALGAYGSTILVAKFGLPFIPALLLGAVIGGVGGFILGLPAVRFRGHNLAMVTLVFQSVVIIGLREWKSMTEGAAGLQVPMVTIAGIPLKSDIDYLAFACIAAALVLLVPIGLLIGRFGRNLKAIAGNEVAAEAFGISIAQHLIAAFVISSAVLAIAGGLQAPRSRIIDPESYGILASIATLAYPIVGGMSSVWGGLMGGATLRLLPELLRPVADYQELLFAGLVLLTVLFFPDGMAGQLAKLRRPKHQVANAGKVQSTAAPALPQAAPVQHDQAALLQVANVGKSFDALRAVDNLTLSVRPGEILGLMGPNGAGKTTLFNMLSGFTKPDTGSISAFGLSLEKQGATSRMAHGITRTFQHVAVFRDLSCYDNVAIGLGGNGILRVLGGSFSDLAARAAGESARQKVMAALEGVGLSAQRNVMAGQLSLGDQRRLEIARAIVSGPRLLLLDEPVSGVSEEEIHRIGALLKKINRETGMAMLLIEHNIGFLAQMSSRIFVMAAGAAITEGTPEQVMANESVQQLYFGKTSDA